MQRQTKAELALLAATMMEAHNVTGITATEDGNFFLPTDQSAANDYAAQTKQEIFGFGDLSPAETVDAVALATEAVDISKAALTVAFDTLEAAKAAQAAAGEDADKDALAAAVETADGVYVEAGKALEAAEAELVTAEKAAKAAEKLAKKAGKAGDERK